MALYFYTNDAAGLLKAFKKLIDNKSVVTWEYDTDGDFTHTAASGQWKNVAWLIPEIRSDRLAFRILGKLNTKMDKEVYGIYHGRFIESMLVHCDEMFSGAYSSALPTDGDYINP